MNSSLDREDRVIRQLVIGAGAAAVLGFLAVVLTITVMVAANFNFLNWME